MMTDAVFDLCEVLLPSTDGAPSSVVIKTETAAVAVLSGLSADVRLDLHGVLDTLPITADLGKRTACAISFVGRQSVTRDSARTDICARIAAGQIQFGVLVFRRGDTRPSTKAWVHSLLAPSKDDAVPLFIDDTEEHITTTQQMCPRIQCRLHTSGDPRQILAWITEAEGGMT